MTRPCAGFPLGVAFAEGDGAGSGGRFGGSGRPGRHVKAQRSEQPQSPERPEEWLNRVPFRRAHRAKACCVDERATVLHDREGWSRRRCGTCVSAVTLDDAVVEVSNSGGQKRDATFWLPRLNGSLVYPTALRIPSAGPPVSSAIPGSAKYRAGRPSKGFDRR